MSLHILHLGQTTQNIIWIPVWNFSNPSFSMLHSYFRITNILKIIWKALYWIWSLILMCLIWQFNPLCNLICIFTYTLLSNYILCVWMCVCLRYIDMCVFRIFLERFIKISKVITSRELDQKCKLWDFYFCLSLIFYVFKWAQLETITIISIKIYSESSVYATTTTKNFRGNN